MTALRERTEYRCDHDPVAVCWLCSDQVPWWRDLRIKRGLSADPPIKDGRWFRYLRRRLAS